jgi:uncharacterized protein RhaS with RHS repeats
LDYFGFRYFSSAQGRWTSPDEPLAGQHPEDPQTWNMYGYGRNNPLRYVDPDGKDIWDTLKGAANAVISDFSLGTNRNNDGNSDFKTGQAIGDAVATVGGALETALGSSGEALGAVLDATGVGALLGVPLNVAAAGVIAQGATATVEGGGHLVSTAIETRRVGDFTSSEKKQMDKANADKNNGTKRCDSCGKEVQKVASKSGEPTPDNQMQRHHDPPLSKGGNGKSPKNKVLCKDCHVEIHKKDNN